LNVIIAFLSTYSISTVDLHLDFTTLCYCAHCCHTIWIFVYAFQQRNNNIEHKLFICSFWHVMCNYA